MQFAILAATVWAIISFMRPDTALFLGFIAVLAIVLHADRANMKREGLMFIRRTRKGKNFIGKVATSWRSGWNIIGYAGIVVGAVAMFCITVWMVLGSYDILTKHAAGGAGIILPGPVDAPISVPGVFIVPWYIWLIGIIAVVVPHEFMHGVMCRLGKVRIKSVGWAFLLFVPAAFVEPDDAQLKKSRAMTQLKVYAAGSFANLTMAALLFLGMQAASSFFLPVGTAFPIIEGTPAHSSGLAGYAIVSIGSVPISSIGDVKVALAGWAPGDTVNITARKFVNGQAVPVFAQGALFASQGVLVGEERAFSVKLANNNGTAFLGVLGNGDVPAYMTSLSGEALSLYSVTFWVYVFSLGIGLFNLLPMKPLDGGPFFETLLRRVTKRAAVITKYVSVAMLILVAFNIIGPYIV